jgi:hypothetical protein
VVKRPAHEANYSPLTSPDAKDVSIVTLSLLHTSFTGRATYLIDAVRICPALAFAIGAVTSHNKRLCDSQSENPVPPPRVPHSICTLRRRSGIRIRQQGSLSFPNYGYIRHTGGARDQ